MSHHDFVFKILIVGDSNVGKTSLLRRYVDETFSDNPLTTVGVDTKVKTVHIPEYDKTAKLQIWDTAGQERYRSLSKMYWTGVAGAILVFAVDDKESFDHLGYWLRELYQGNTCKFVLLVGNKSDVPQDSRLVPHKRGHEFADDNQLEYVETSAKLNEGVEQAFLQMTRAILKDYADRGRLLRPDADPEGLVDMDKDEEMEEKRRSCC